MSSYKSPKDRIKELSHLINFYNSQYFKENSSRISDYDFDALFQELLVLEETYPEYKDLNSPTQRVGSDLIQSFEEEPHLFPVLSLDKVYDEEKLFQWMGKFQSCFSIEHKMDGVSLTIYYEKGRFIKALTRGDGTMGSNISDNVKTISDIPLILNFPADVVIRGEAFVLKSDFQKLNSQQEMQFANPRNLTSGVLRRQKSSEVAAINIKFIAYEAFWQDRQFSTHYESLSEMASLGLPISKNIAFWGEEYKKNSCKDIACELIEENATKNKKNAYSNLRFYLNKQNKNRHKLDYEIDGLVIKINDLSLRNQLGNTSHHPRWALALKFVYQEAETILEDIILQVGRTGRVSPLALVKPVVVAGVIIKRATLHNESYINSLGLRKGDRVVISRRGDVIPAIERVIHTNNSHPEWKMSPNCPECKSPIVLEGAHYFCQNLECPARLKSQLVFFAGKTQMNIQSLSKKTIEFLFDNHMIRYEADLYKLDFSLLSQLDGMGETSSNNLKRALEKSLNQSFEKQILSLGLKDIGVQFIRLLSQKGYTSFSSYVDLAKDPSAIKILSEIKGIGKKLAENFIQQILSPNVRKRVKNLKDVGFSFEENKNNRKSVSGIFLGQIWCITGSFIFFKNRSQISQIIEEQGGEVRSSLSQEVTHLLVGENSGQKYEQARKRSIICWFEKDFIDEIKKSKISF